MELSDIMLLDLQVACVSATADSSSVLTSHAWLVTLNRDGLNYFLGATLVRVVILIKIFISFITKLVCVSYILQNDLLKTMPNKNLCNKCNKKHFLPMGKRCKYLKKGLVKSDNDINAMPHGGVPVKSTHIESDSNIMPQGGVPEPKGKNKIGVYEILSESSFTDKEPSMQLQILQELKRGDSKLDVVEDRMASGELSQCQKRKHKADEQSKLSRKSRDKLCGKK